MRFATIFYSLLSVVPLLLLLAPSPIVEAAPKPPTRKPTTKPVKIPVLSPVAKKIAQYAPGAYNAFVPGSIQKKSLTYVESLSTANSLTAAKAVQYYALGVLFYGTYGVKNVAWSTSNSGTPPGWYNKTNWLSPTFDPCSTGKNAWKGILCTSGKVVRISLPSNRLIGTIPFEITLLASNNPSGSGALNYLEFYDNPYLLNVGVAGNAYIGRLGPAMKYLYLGSTSLYSTTGVPDGVGALVNLVELDVSYTLISGAIHSTSLGALKKLEYLELDGNSYNSSLPSFLATLPSLKFLYAINANVFGNLNFVNGMKKIEELWVDKNYIKGKLPTTLGTLVTLKSFSVSRNQLTGSFPTQMAKLVNMEQMWYYSNKLSGSFPNFLTTMKKLQTFRLESNKVKGNVATLCSALGKKPLTSLGVDCTGSNPLVKCTSPCSVCCCSLTACKETL